MSETPPMENPSVPESPLILNNSNPLFAALPSERQTLLAQYDAERTAAQQEIEALAKAGRQPGAHGTSSNYLPSILEHGLGAVMPVGALARSKSTTDATTPDGMLGAYLFAKGLKGDTLAIRREEVDPAGDALARYTQLSPGIQEPLLRRQIVAYFTRRAEAVGGEYASAYPVLLVVTADPEEMKAMNPYVPSERVFEGVFGKERVSMIFVPEAKQDQAQQLIDRFNLPVKARAIEPLELF